MNIRRWGKLKKKEAKKEKMMRKWVRKRKQEKEKN